MPMANVSIATRDELLKIRDEIGFRTVNDVIAFMIMKVFNRKVNTLFTYEDYSKIADQLKGKK